MRDSRGQPQGGGGAPSSEQGHISPTPPSSVLPFASGLAGLWSLGQSPHEGCCFCPLGPKRGTPAAHHPI